MWEPAWGCLLIDRAGPDVVAPVSELNRPLIISKELPEDQILRKNPGVVLWEINDKEPWMEHEAYEVEALFEELCIVMLYFQKTGDVVNRHSLLRSSTPSLHRFGKVN
jgi:hypothetical protein